MHHLENLALLLVIRYVIPSHALAPALPQWQPSATDTVSLNGMIEQVLLNFQTEVKGHMVVSHYSGWYVCVLDHHLPLREAFLSSWCGLAPVQGHVSFLCWRID